MDDGNAIAGVRLGHQGLEDGGVAVEGEIEALSVAQPVQGAGHHGGGTVVPSHGVDGDDGSFGVLGAHRLTSLLSVRRYPDQPLSTTSTSRSP